MTSTTSTAGPLPIVDLRGLELSDPERKGASDPQNASAAATVIAGLVERAAGFITHPTSDRYFPTRIVVDNYGGTVVGELEADRA